MGPLVVSAWKFGAIEPRRRLHHGLAGHARGQVLDVAYGAGRSSPVDPIFCVRWQDELDGMVSLLVSIEMNGASEVEEKLI